MHRRFFLTLLGTSAAASAWPLAARAQQRQRMRRLGVLLPYAERDTRQQHLFASFRQGLQDLGWVQDRTLLIDVRLADENPTRAAAGAKELLALAPDVLFAPGATTRPLQQATRTVPIVFANLNDPVGAGVVASLARPGGTTGF